MYEVKQWQDKKMDGRMERWIFVRVSKTEAAALIKSLSAQLERNNSNFDRVEARFGSDKSKPPEGYFTISVHEDPHCLSCGTELEAFTGVRYKESLLCPGCAKTVCAYCRHLGHTAHCPKMLAKPVPPAAPPKKSKAKKKKGSLAMPTKNRRSYILAYEWLTDGDEACNKKVRITPAEYESLKPCRGFPDEIDLQGGAGYDQGPSWIYTTHGDLDEDPYDRKSVRGPADVTVLIY